MKKQLLLSTLLGAVMALGIAQGAHAATSATQTCTGTLGQMKQVVGNGTPLTATIDTNDGTLSTALVPAFTMTTNTSASTPLTLKATCNTTTVAQNAFVGDGTTNYLVLTNNTVKPIAGAVDDAKLATPTAANNGNVIAYSIGAPTFTSGQLAYTWNAGGNYWDAALTHKGNTNTSLTTGTAPKTNTYSFDDEPGDYQATITMSF